MERRSFPGADLEVPIISFGAWAIGGWMWGGSDEKEAEKAIFRALDCGINCIDTAPVYGFGRSEEIVGKAIRGLRSEVIVATKCGLRWDREEGEFFFETKDLDGRALAIWKNLRAASVIEECEGSLKRLGIERIDIFQCHFPDESTPSEETMGALIRLLEQGKIRSIGVSNFSAAQMEQFRSVGPVHSDQPHYSLLHRDIEADVLPYCRENGIAVLTHSTMERGLLAGKIGLNQVMPEDDHRSKQVWFQPQNRGRALEALQQINPIAERHHATLGQIAIRWILNQPGVTTAIVGARNPRQVEENARVTDLSLTDEEMEEIRRVFESVGDPIREES